MYSSYTDWCHEKAVDGINSNRNGQNKMTKHKEVICETKWSKTNKSLGSFSVMHESIFCCLEEISSNVGRTWDPKNSVIDGKWLLTNNTDFTLKFYN